MPYLYDNNSNQRIAEITDEQLQFMIDNMEEEWLEDRDYSITPLEIDYWETHGVAPELLDPLKQALAGRSEVIVRWSRA